MLLSGALAAFPIPAAVGSAQKWTEGPAGADHSVPGSDSSYGPV
jgi:hypothetical protein